MSAATSQNMQKSRSGALAAATGACVMCHSLRVTAACSASSALNSTLHRHGNTSLQSAHSSTIANPNHHAMSSIANAKYSQHHMLQSDNPLSNSSSSHLATNPHAITKASIHSSSNAQQLSSSLVSDALCGITGQAMNSTATLGGGINDTGWSMGELFGAMFLASAAATGSLFLGPFGDFKVDGAGHKGGGSGGPSGGGGGHKKIGSAGGGNDNRYEEDTDEPQVKVGIATAPPSYEVRRCFVYMHRC